LSFHVPLKSTPDGGFAANLSSAQALKISIAMTTAAARISWYSPSNPVGNITTKPC
jgi:hypothetical protein